MMLRVVPRAQHKVHWRRINIRVMIFSTFTHCNLEFLILLQSWIPIDSNHISNHNVSFPDRQFLDKLAQKLQITSTEQWYGVTLNSILHHGGRVIISKYEYSLCDLLNTVYPELEYLYLPCYLNAVVHVTILFKYCNSFLLVSI